MSSICQICSKDESKYKCSLCRTPYCSIICYKIHKEVHEEAKEENNQGTKKRFQTESLNKDISNKVPPSCSLAGNEALMMLFTRYPDLRNRLHAIYSITLEPSLTGVGKCSERDFNMNRNKSPWTQERADQRAIQALHHALTKENEESILEFAQLTDTNQIIDNR